MRIKRPRLTFAFLKRLPSHETRMTVATMVTLARIALVPVIVGSMVIGQWGTAFSFFVVAALTDLFDGLLARWNDEKTFLGACLDPIADKILLVSCFFTLGFVQSPLFSIPLWFVALVVCKEVLQITGSILFYYNRGYLDVQPTMLGKSTTVYQMGFIVWLFACYFFHWVPTKTYYVMLSTMVGLICASFVQYALIGLRQWRKVA